MSAAPNDGTAADRPTPATPKAQGEDQAEGKRPLPLRSKTHAALGIWATIACGYVFLVPVSHNRVLIPVVASIGAVSVYWFVTSRPQIHRRLLLPILLWLALIASGSIVAAIYRADGWLRVMVFMLGIPAFMVFLTSVFRRAFIRPVIYLGAAVTLFSSSVLISQALVAMGHLRFLRLPDAFYSYVGLQYAIDPSGPMRLNSTLLPPMLWWGAMWIASLFVRRGDDYLPPTSIRLVAATLSIAAAVLSLRRAIIVSLIATPIICLLVAVILFFRLHGRWPLVVRRANVAAVFAVFAAAAAIVMVVQPKSYEVLGASVRSIVAVATNHNVVIGTPQPGSTETAISAAPPTTSGPTSDGTNLGVKGSYDTIRQNEARILLSTKNVREALVGRGIGATVDRGSYTRAGLGERPWQSDLPYLLLYYWTGYVGVALALSVVVTALMGLRYAAQRAGELGGVLLVSTVGATALVIANASNPYMQALGHVWPLFLPFMIANVILVGHLTPAGRGQVPQSAEPPVP